MTDITEYKNDVRLIVMYTVSLPVKILLVIVISSVLSLYLPTTV